jgi:effector-binding domain-containing protein
MFYEVSVLDVPAQWVVSVRRRLGAGEIPLFIGESFGQIYGHLAKLGVESTAAPFVIYHQFGPDGIDAEACAPIARRIAPAAPVRVRKLHAATVARTVHIGPYEELGGAYQSLTEWIDDHGREPAGPVRERYLTGPADALPPTLYQTEIEMPISPAPVALPV